MTPKSGYGQDHAALKILFANKVECRAAGRKIGHSAGMLACPEDRGYLEGHGL